MGNTSLSTAAMKLVLMAAVLFGASFPVSAGDKICAFQARGLSISFGILNPASALDATANVSASTLTADTAGDCVPSKTMVIDGDNGLHYSGSRRLANAAGTDFIPYSLVGLPLSQPGPGDRVYVRFTFSGTILATAYADAPAGTYSDRVIISVTP